ncbi:MAG: carbohydrate ABC transporter permease [Candidatus Limiplasma sp.]|nr:carbohydrate ABC transporter permease [Candidatus Limiplasma sp.]
MRDDAQYLAKRKKSAARIVKYAVCILISALMLAPFYWMISTSLKEYSKVLLFPPQWWPKPIVWQNYADLFSMQPFGLYLWNSVYIAAVVTLGVVVFASLAGYAFAKLEFRGRNALFLVILSGMMMPVEITTIPLFIALSKVRLVDSHFPMIVPQIFGYCGAFGVFLMRQFFLTVPNELMEAGKIDGCSQPRIFLRIMMPMATSMVATLVIFTFLQNWNEFFVPLIYLSSSKLYTIPLALSLFTTENGVQWHLIMAAASVSTLPILVVFFFAQRKFIESLTMSGLK